MTQSLTACSKCQTPLPAALLNAPELLPCPGCGVSIRALVFPALFRSQGASQIGATVLVEGESSCFYHPQKQATLPCDRCGRFLCALCDVELDQEHICPSCVESGQQKGKMEKLQTRRVLHDDIALGLAVWPMLIWPFTLFSAPAALYFAIRHWNGQSSIIPRSKARKIAAITLATLQIAGWVTAFVALALGWFS